MSMCYYCGECLWRGWLTIVLQCYDTVGWVVWPVKSSLKWPIMCRVGCYTFLYLYLGLGLQFGLRTKSDLCYHATQCACYKSVYCRYCIASCCVKSGVWYLSNNISWLLDLGFISDDGCRAVRLVAGKDQDDEGRVCRGRLCWVWINVQWHPGIGQCPTYEY